MSTDRKNLDIETVETIFHAMKYLEQVLPFAISRWRGSALISGDCANARGSMIKGNMLKQVCESPSTLRGLIFEPMYSFLNTYIQNRVPNSQGKLLALTGSAKTTFLLKGLTAIHNFVQVADFFSRHPDFLTSSGTEAEKTKALILKLEEAMIGCNQVQQFAYLSLSKDIPEGNLSLDIQNKLIDLKAECNSIKIEQLASRN